MDIDQLLNVKQAEILAILQRRRCAIAAKHEAYDEGGIVEQSLPDLKIQITAILQELTEEL